MTAACFMSSALLMSLGIVFYGLGAFDVVQLCFAFAMHLVIGWIYLFVSVLFLNRALPTEKKNPFLPKGK